MKTRTVAIALFVLNALVPQAQAQSTPIQRGIVAAMHGRCDPAMLTVDQQNLAVAMGAFSSPARERLLNGYRGLEQATLIQMCAHQVHHHRCSKPIVDLAGDVLERVYRTRLQSIQPDPRRQQAQSNALAISGAVAGSLLGAAISGKPVSGWTAGLGVLGWKGGGKLDAAREVAQCRGRQRELDAIGDRLGGQVSLLSHTSVGDLISRDLRNGRMSQQQVDILVDEINRLLARSTHVLQALQ